MTQNGARPKTERKWSASEAKRPVEPSVEAKKGRGTEEEADKVRQDRIRKALVKDGRHSGLCSRSWRKPLKAVE